MRLHRRALSRRGAHCAPGERCRCASYVPAHHGLKLWPARPHCGQEGEHLRFSPSCQSTPFPLGRAARVRVSDAFRLPPNCHYDRQGIGCHPSGAHPPGTRPERRLHANSNRKPYIASTPASRVRRKTKLPRRYRKQIFPQNVDKFVCGRGHPRTSPAGVIRKRGQGPPLAREAAAHTRRSGRPASNRPKGGS